LENNDYFKELLLRYARGNISDQEKEALFASLNEQANEDLWKDRIRELSFTGKAGDELHTVDWEPVIRSILSSAPAEAPVAGRQVRLLKQWRNVAAAAAIILLAGAAYYIYSGAPEKPVAQSAAAEPVKDIAPGKDGAILTLSDGSAIVLDNLESGLVSTQGNAQLIISNGQLAYKQTGTASDETLYNTITTPRGRQYRLQLPDGTEVWLNAASSIRYPTAFAGGERKVNISGEAYFEVAKRPDMPFKVIAGGSSEIEALGTHFNVNAYTDETSLNTTLLEGLIKVSAVNDKPVLVKPGQQAQIGPHTGKVRIVEGANTDNIMAWKNGAFSFEDASLKDVLRQIARWYDVEIDYRGNISDKIIRGKMGRDLSLLQMIAVLKGLRVNLMLEGDRKLIVLPEEGSKS